MRSSMPINVVEPRPRAALIDSAYSFAFFSAAMLSTGIFAVVLWLTLNAIFTIPDAAQAAATLGVLQSVAAVLFKPEPVENAVFGLTTAAGVAFCILAAGTSHVSRSFIRRRTAVIVAALFVASTLAWLYMMDWSSIIPPTPSFLVTAAQSNLDLFFALCVAAATMVGFLSFVSARSQVKYLPVFACIVPLAVFSRMVLFNNNDGYLGSTHYEVFVYPLIQDWLGQGIYIGQKSQYGMYALFLRPLWALTGGPTTTAISGAMAALLLIANVALVTFMVRYAKYPALAATFALLGITVALLLYPFWPGDAYFEFFPVRLIFPALAMVFLCWRPTRERHQLLCYVALAFGLAWNFESGVVGLAIYGTFTIASAFTPNMAIFTRLVLRHTAMATGAVAITITTIAAYYVARFGEMPDLSGAIAMIRAFSAGVGAEPMPPFGAWVIHVLIYGAAIFVGVRALWHTQLREERERAAALVAVAVAGLLWLRYYQGRSMPLPLAFVSIYAICCAGLLIDRAINAFQYRQQLIAALVALIISAPLLASVALWVQSGPVPQRSLEGFFEEQHPPRMDLVVNQVLKTFNSVKQRQSDELIVIAPYAHLVHLRLGKASPILSAGMCQIWFETEILNIARSLSNPNTRMVVFDRTDACPFTRADLDSRIGKVLDQSFFEVAPWGGCGPVSTVHLRVFMRNGTPLPAITTTANSRPLINVALGKLPLESSSILGSTASLAVDGEVDGRYSEQSTTHTSFEPNPWWQIDLGATTRLDSVEIWNRTDCCSERLNDFFVFASDKPFAPTDTPATLCARGDIFSSYIDTTPSPNIHVRTATAARYIRIQKNGIGYLSLAEVRIWHR